MRLTTELARRLLRCLPGARAIYQDFNGEAHWSAGTLTYDTATGLWVREVTTGEPRGTLGMYGLADASPRAFYRETPLEIIYPCGTEVWVRNASSPQWYAKCSAGSVDLDGRLRCWTNGTRFTSYGHTESWKYVKRYTHGQELQDATYA